MRQFVANSDCETLHVPSLMSRRTIRIPDEGGWRCRPGDDVCSRGVHGDGEAGIPRNPRVSRGCGRECCGNTAGMDQTIAGFPRGWILLRREPALNRLRNIMI